MRLSDLTRKEKQQVTQAYPVWLIGENDTGKSYSAHQMTDEEKAVTVYFDLDAKLPLEERSKYLKVYSIIQDYMPLKEQEALEASLDQMIAAGSSGKKLIDFRKSALLKVEQILAPRIVTSIMEAIASPKSERVFIDSFTMLSNYWSIYHNKMFKGFDVYSKQNAMIGEWIHDIKEYTYTFGKFVYVTAHLSTTDRGKQFIHVDGNQWKERIESAFSTVIRTHKDSEEPTFEVTRDSMDTTRAPAHIANFEIPNKGVGNLEEFLTTKKE